jgi:hypothetical protein
MEKEYLYFSSNSDFGRVKNIYPVIYNLSYAIKIPYYPTDAQIYNS